MAGILIGTAAFESLLLYATAENAPSRLYTGWVLPPIDSLLQTIQICWASKEIVAKQLAQIYAPVFRQSTHRLGNSRSTPHYLECTTDLY